MEIKTQKVEELDRREDPGQQEAGKGRSHPTSRCSLGTFSLFQRYFATSFSEQSLRENLLLVVNKKIFSSLKTFIQVSNTNSNFKKYIPLGLNLLVFSIVYGAFKKHFYSVTIYFLSKLTFSS